MTKKAEFLEPAPMPVDAKRWKEELNLSNFINAYYEFRDLQSCSDCQSILLIGPGQGLDREILRWRGYRVTTFDIDETFNPDYRGSVHDLSMFGDLQFDAVIASHVLEHLPLRYLDSALGEIARVGRFALVYVPVHGRHAQLRLVPGFRALDLSLVVNLFNIFHRPDGLTPRYMQNQHYWELGMRGFRVKDLVRRFSRFFHVVRHYRNRDWLPSYNFVLRSKPAGIPVKP